MDLTLTIIRLLQRLQHHHPQPILYHIGMATDLNQSLTDKEFLQALLDYEEILEYSAHITPTNEETDDEDY